MYGTGHDDGRADFFQAHLKSEIEVFLTLKELSWLKIWFPEIRSQDVSLSLLVVVFEFCCDFDVNRLYQSATLSQKRQIFSNFTFMRYCTSQKT